tara:strand:+ start:805 stop:939 length:135 start_codon:yes stop_codon:yes gene_type:complete
MNFTNLILTIFLSGVSFYVIFLVLGVGGVSKNRVAQGIDKKSNN